MLNMPDYDKLYDFMFLSKEEFLFSYSYLDEKEYKRISEYAALYVLAKDISQGFEDYTDVEVAMIIEGLFKIKKEMSCSLSELKTWVQRTDKEDSTLLFDELLN